MTTLNPKFEMLMPKHGPGCLEFIFVLSRGPCIPIRAATILFRLTPEKL